ncbi:septation protein A [Hydrocarboniclastica marina]|uniref:Inner membrane-spanning protein YciB n=1 Tax=Hydrocarboniclastica marina TaxID=2259620 RepID=A0A4P7XF79_9ALTE|nr:septation protein A [Hydrocarboniclastica marina]QCF25591.1 septation protein A [Hydrocarboniclastica marina]
MKQFLDFIPLIVFFAVYQYSGDMISATIALIIVTMAQVAFMWLRFRKVEKVHLITLAAVVVFGGLTVLLNDNTFIMWKPTIVNWVLAAVLLGSHLLLGKNLIRKMLAANMKLPETVWARLNTAWVLFFVLTGALNLYIAFNFSQETWVNFKVFGLLLLTLGFAVAQILLLSRHLKEEEPL